MKRCCLWAVCGTLVGLFVGFVWVYVDTVLKSIRRGNFLSVGEFLESIGSEWEGTYSFYCLFGMGFGAVTGAVIGGVGVLVQTLREELRAIPREPPRAHE